MRPRNDIDEVREERIDKEILIDACGEEERAASWYAYLGETLRFPFYAICTEKRAISPLAVNDEIDVDAMGSVEKCQREIFVVTRWRPDDLAIPLSQLRVGHGYEETVQAVEDWRKQGCRF